MTADAPEGIDNGKLQVHGFLNGHVSPVSCIAVSRHSDNENVAQIATGDVNGIIYIWDISNGIPRSTIKVSTTVGITALCFFGTNLIAAAGNTIYKYDLDETRILGTTTFGDADDEINWLTTSQGKVIACSDDGRVVSFGDNLDYIVLARHESIAMAAACDPFDDFVLSVGCDHEIKLVANGLLKSWDINSILAADSSSTSINLPFGNCVVVVPTSNPSYIIGLGDGSLIALHRRRPKNASDRKKEKDFCNWKVLSWRNCHSNPVTAIDVFQTSDKQYNIVTATLYGEFKFWRASDLLDTERHGKGLEAKHLHSKTSAEFKAINAVTVVDDKLYVAGIYKKARPDRKGGAVTIYEYPNR